MALAVTAWLASEQGDYYRDKEACEEGLELLAHEEGREASEAKLWLLVLLGWVALQREEHGQAQQLYEESLDLSREMSDIWVCPVSTDSLPLGYSTSSQANLFVL
jgi:hypothetical protein